MRSRHSHNGCFSGQLHDSIWSKYYLASPQWLHDVIHCQCSDTCEHYVRGHWYDYNHAELAKRVCHAGGITIQMFIHYHCLSKLTLPFNICRLFFFIEQQFWRWCYTWNKNDHMCCQNIIVKLCSHYWLGFFIGSFRVTWFYGHWSFHIHCCGHHTRWWIAYIYIEFAFLVFVCMNVVVNSIIVIFL